MKRKAAFVAVVLLCLSLPPAQGARKQATSGDDLGTLEDYIADLQKNPGNEALRIKIINLVGEMKRPPAIPEEARRYMGRGKAAFKIAKSAVEFKDAVAEFEKATNAAPWLANAYLNLGVAQKEAGQNKAAMASLKLYLLAEPNAPDTGKVKQTIYELEFVQEKGAKGFSPDTDFKAWLARLNGSKWWNYSNSFMEGYRPYILLQGDVLSWWQLSLVGDQIIMKWRVKLEKRTFDTRQIENLTGGSWVGLVTWEISEDGNTIIEKGPGGSSTYTKEK